MELEYGSDDNEDYETYQKRMHEFASFFKSTRNPDEEDSRVEEVENDGQEDKEEKEIEVDSKGTKLDTAPIQTNESNENKTG